jgi:DNA-binding NarL/FixJ family response regulator
MTRSFPRWSRRAGAARPRVLLVDDHRGVLEHLTQLLSDHFDIAGVATDGMQALAGTRRLAPDAIVLDINMPGLDGFQTLRSLARGGSRPPTVFLSMHDAEDVVAEAFHCGGQGYVLKAHAARDLANALDHVLAGRMFVPSLVSLLRLAKRGGHAMQLHDGAEPFADRLAAFIDLALRQGDATCVIAPGEIREALAVRLGARGWNVDAPSGEKRYLALDAADALNRFMRDGLPDQDRLAEIAAELDQYRRNTGGPASRLTIFGNMAALLSAAGNHHAAIALESTWDRLTRDLPFLTVCGYPTACLHDGVVDLYARACAEHWAVGHSSELHAA